MGLHPGMTGFKDLFDCGNLSIMQGVGYPNPNRSHFRSTEIWQTASDSEKIEKYGWLGRYFDNACRGLRSDRGREHRKPDAAVFCGKDADRRQPRKIPKATVSWKARRGRPARNLIAN